MEFSASAVFGLLLLVVGQAAADDNNIMRTCMQGKEKLMCVLTMRADRRAVACPDSACLAPIAVEHAIRNTSDTRTILELLSHDPQQRHVSALQTCSEVYANAMAHLAQALPMAKVENYIGAEAAVGLARRQAAGCEAAFPDRPSPVAKLNMVCAAMIVVAQDLIDIADSTVDS